MGTIERVASGDLFWRRERAEDGRPVYVGTGAHGTYRVDGNGYGRMRWTVYYSDDEGDYGITDSLAEAKRWAEIDHAVAD